MAAVVKVDFIYVINDIERNNLGRGRRIDRGWWDGIFGCNRILWKRVVVLNLIEYFVFWGGICVC
jgi:hypothetical protein